MAITFNHETRIIEVGSPTTEVSIQQLVDAIRAYEQTEEGITVPKIGDVFGVEDLWTGSSTMLTLRLNSWKLAFAARPGPSYVECSVVGGNLIAMDDIGLSVSPIHPTAFTQVTRVMTAAFPTPNTIASAVRVELSVELAKINSQVDGLTNSQLTMLMEIYELLGLDPTKPLIVTETTRTAGDNIRQRLDMTSGQTTVTRQ